MKRLLFIFSLCLLCSSCSVWLTDVTPSSTHCVHYHRPVPPPPPPAPPQPHHHNPPKSVHKPSGVKPQPNPKPSGVRPQQPQPNPKPSAPKPSTSRPRSSSQSREQHR